MAKKKTAKKEDPDDVVVYKWKKKHRTALAKTKQAKAKKEYDADTQAIHEGKTNLPVKRTRRGGITYKNVLPNAYERQERLVYVAALVRKGKSNQQIVNFLMTKYKLSKVSAQKYLKRVYLEFQDRYTDNDRAILMYEHLEALNEGATIALRNGQLMAYEKIRRQYAECMGLLMPQSAIPAGNNQNNIQVNVNNEGGRDAEAAKLDMNTLEKLSGDDLYSRFIEGRSDSQDQLPESRPEIGVGSGKEEGLPGESSPDNDEGQAA